MRIVVESEANPNWNKKMENRKDEQVSLTQTQRSKSVKFKQDIGIVLGW